ncbi:MAG: UDP-N-acetylmuramoyl-L-alanyl-D-glutamate--2,6-diaminopimelate ligase [Deltaproteobacteria bacterium]|nr:UDP-N-acetylmuramoyl-L-alanyl-D-glutamate--2,6-diaminopimelate ligase [Deltaproteobacteria bacterium]
MNMNLAEIIALLPNAKMAGLREVDITGVCAHASEVLPGNLYVAITGQSFDGHAYIPEAIARGAAVVLAEKQVALALSVPLLVVQNTRQAVGPIAALLAGNPSKRMTMIGVTGTNGKTTTTALLESIFAAAGEKPGVIGTLGMRIDHRQTDLGFTTPDAVRLQACLKTMVNAGVGVCAMEVSSHALMQARVAGCHFDAAIFTNLTSEHLDYHGTMERYFAAKERFFTELLMSSDKRPRIVAVNADDPYGQRLYPKSEHLYRFSLRSGADVHCLSFETTSEGLLLHLKTFAGELRLRSRLVGHFNAMNILGAVTIALGLNVDRQAIEAGIAAMERVPGRFEVVPNDKGILALVDYAHTPDALQNVLTEARKLSRGRLFVVFGCGGDRDRSKRPLMGAVAAKLADMVIVTSDNPRSENPQSIINAIVPGVANANYEVILDRRQAIERATQLAVDGDTILVAGKGHEDYQIIGSKRSHFDDREELRRLLCS